MLITHAIANYFIYANMHYISVSHCAVYVTNLIFVLQLQLVLQATLWSIALLQILSLSRRTLHPLTNKMDSFVTTSFIALQLEVAPWSTQLQTLLKSPFKTCYLSTSTVVLLLPLPLILDQQVSCWPSHSQNLVSDLYYIAFSHIS